MKSVTIGFSRNHGPFSLLIQLLTLSRVSHCYAKFGVTEYGEEVVFHAHGNSVTALNAKEFYPKNWVVAEFQFTIREGEIGIITKFLLESLGRPYSLLQCVGVLWVMVGKGLGRKWKNPFRNGDAAWNCSEVAARILRMDGSEELTPVEILREIEARRIGVRLR